MDLAQILWTAIASGGATFVVIQVKLAVTEQIARDAKDAAKDAHERLDRHISELHTLRPK